MDKAQQATGEAARVAAARRGGRHQEGGSIGGFSRCGVEEHHGRAQCQHTMYMLFLSVPKGHTPSVQPDGPPRMSLVGEPKPTYDTVQHIQTCRVLPDGSTSKSPPKTDVCISPSKASTTDAHSTTAPLLRVTEWGIPTTIKIPANTTALGNKGRHNPDICVYACHSP